MDWVCGCVIAAADLCSVVFCIMTVVEQRSNLVLGIVQSQHGFARAHASVRAAPADTLAWLLMPHLQSTAER
jgi:hypothetical protein